MGGPIAFTVQDGRVMVDLHDFSRRFAAALPPLLEYLKSPQFACHERWARLMPFDVPSYGRRPSVGHCVRPDILLTADGPRVCELDFVPSGRGFTLAELGSPEREALLSAFDSWYEAMEAGHVLYATGTTTVCFLETVRFAQALHQLTDRAIEAVNIDDVPSTHGALVDRLFYASECDRPGGVDAHTVITAEPYLDSKMVFAVVHDAEMTGDLTAAVGAENLAFLREVMIETHALTRLRAEEPEFLVNEVLGRAADGSARRHGWLVKTADVESAASWGSRSVVLGPGSTEAVFAAAIRGGIARGRKDLGRRQVLQPFLESDDLRRVWDAAVDGDVAAPDPAKFGWAAGPATQQPATRKVYGRFGLFFLVANTTGQVFVPPAGPLTIRQDRVAHGAPDALILPFINRSPGPEPSER
jgi:hypothetical protein